MELPAKRLAQVTRDLVQAGWRVEAEGKLIRPASEFKLAVTTGIDWFELGGQVDFGGQSVALPDLLDAAPAGRDHGHPGRRLDGDAPRGLAQEVRRARRPRATAENGHVRFSSAQAGLLDALLAAQPEIQVDAAFAKVRESLHQFEGVKPLDAAAGLPRRAPPLPVRGPRLARLPPEVRLRRHPRRRHGPGQDDPGAGPAPAAAVAPAGEGAVAGRRPPLAGLQLDPGGRQVHARGSACSTTPARTATPSATQFRQPRPDHHHLRHPPHRHRRAGPDRLRLRDPRRGAGDQERRQPGRQGRPPAPRPATAWR